MGLLAQSFVFYKLADIFDDFLDRIGCDIATLAVAREVGSEKVEVVLEEVELRAPTPTHGYD